MEKKIIWTDQAKGDLQTIYWFNSLVLDEEKSFQLIETIIKKTDRLTRIISGGTSFRSDLTPTIPYQKLVYKHYLVIYRVETDHVYILKIFDSRQNPKKLKL